MLKSLATSFASTFPSNQQKTAWFKVDISQKVRTAQISQPATRCAVFSHHRAAIAFDWADRACLSQGWSSKSERKGVVFKLSVTGNLVGWTQRNVTTAACSARQMWWQKRGRVWLVCGVDPLTCEQKGGCDSGNCELGSAITDRPGSQAIAIQFAIALSGIGSTRLRENMWSQSTKLWCIMVSEQAKIFQSQWRFSGNLALCCY